MEGRSLSSLTGIPSTTHTDKDVNLLDLSDINSLIRRSLPSKPNVGNITSSPSPATTLSAASSTGLLTIYCIETGSVAQSIRCRQSLTDTTVISNNVEMTTTPIDEGRLLNSRDKLQELLTDAEKTAAINDGDNISLGDEDDDDDDETIVDDSLYPQSFPAPPNCVMSPCPICFEQAVLQVSSCCYFLCCNSCWRAHILATLNDGRIKIPCAANECNKYLTREAIVNFVRHDQPLHEHFLKSYSIANQNPRAKTCPRCCHPYCLDTIKSIPLINKKNLSNKKIPKQVQCPECSLVWCFRCMTPWHENMTCKQFLKGDKLLLKWINQKNEEQWNARKCPKCSSLIQRTGGCPHMTCQSCSCEFCYLCGRRYYQIPFIGQHSNRFSIFGCPYNFYPEKPWLRRTIRGMITTGVIVASPIIITGAVTAAITVLPSFGIYKLAKHIRNRRRARTAADLMISEPFLNEPNLDDQQALAQFALQFDLQEVLAPADMIRFLRQRTGGLFLTQTFDREDTEHIDDEISRDFPLSIFAEMDIEHLFSDDDNDESNSSPSGFRTCPTTPAPTIRQGCSRSLNDLTVTCESFQIS